VIFSQKSYLFKIYAKCLYIKDVFSSSIYIPKYNGSMAWADVIGHLLKYSRISFGTPEFSHVLYEIQKYSCSLVN
jgi:hypothetical protein